MDKSMKEISITNNNNSNHNTGEETDSNEETPNKKTSGKPFLNWIINNYHSIDSVIIFIVIFTPWFTENMKSNMHKT